jgi:mevalonate kinase
VPFGHGKVILLGEHSVVYGRPALAASLDRGVLARGAVARSDELVIEPWGVSALADAESDDPLARAYAAILALHGPDRPAVRVQAEVALPGSAGLGCSAALGVAVLRAVDEALGVSRSDRDVGETSLVWERIFHGNPSGVDNAMAAGAGMALFRRGAPLEPVRPRAPLTLVIANSGEAGSTKEMVASVGRQHERDPSRLEQTFDGIASLVRNARLAAEAGDLPALGKLMDLNQALLGSLLVSTEALESLCERARNAGALGAKLTGAGGGGCIIALAEHRRSAEDVRLALAPHAAESFIVEAGR